MDIILRSQLTLPSITDLSIAGTSNIRHFLQEICIHFTLDNVSQFGLSFLQSLFYFLARLMAFSVPWKCSDRKFVGNSSPYSSLWLMCFLVAKMPKRNGTGIEIWIPSWRIMLYMDNHFSYAVRISTNQRNSILVYFIDWLFYALQRRANQWLSNHHISIYTLQYILFRLFLFPTPTFDILWFQLHYTLTL